MPSANLERLVGRGLKAEPPIRAEFEGLIRSAAAKLADAQKPNNSAESRFDLAYGAAHALALAGLRWHGYRADNRYLVFQVLPHTLGTPAASTRVLAKCHEQRNRAEYEGFSEIDHTLLTGLLEAASTLLDQVRALSVPPETAE